MLTTPTPIQLDRLVGLAMLIAASAVFAYYTIWTLVMVRNIKIPPANPPTRTINHHCEN